MKSLFIMAACAAAFTASSLPCTAADITGLIRNVDVLSRTVTLGNGQTYRLPQSAKPTTFKIGDTIAIEYSADVNGLLVASVIALHSRSWYSRPHRTSPVAGA